MKRELSPNDVYQLNQFIAKAYGFDGFIRIGSRVELVDAEVILIDNRPAWFYYNKKLAPTIQTLIDYTFLKKIYVENLAVPYVQTKKEVMRPSIVKLDTSLKKDEFVCVINEKWDRPFAVGITLYTGADIDKLKAGKVADIIHHVGDRIWEMVWGL